MDGLIFFSAICYLDITKVVEILYTGLSHKDKMIQEVLDNLVYLVFGLVSQVWFFSQLYTYLSHFKSESYHVKSKVRLLNEYITTNYCFGTFGLVQFGFLLDNLFDCLVGLFFSHSCRYPTHFKSDLYSLRNKVGLLK